MSRRSRAREVALQSLYQGELNTIDPRDRARFHKGRL
jgi:transcription termination factor NusB